MQDGKYIAIDGIDGVGKTTVIERLARELQAMQVPVMVINTNHPSDATGQAAKRILDDPRYPTGMQTKVLLGNAVQAQVLETIRQALASGTVCLANHSYLTALVHEYYGRGDITDYALASQIIHYATGHIPPSLHILLDAPATAAKARFTPERQASFDEAYQERVRAGYLWEAKQRNLAIVYATEPADTVFNTIWQQVSALLGVSAAYASPRSAQTSDSTPSATETSAASPSTKPGVEPATTKPTKGSKKAKDTPKSRYYTSASLKGKLRTQYTTTMDELLDAHDKLIIPLAKHLAATAETAGDNTKADHTAEAQTILQQLLPVAANGELASGKAPNQALQKIADDILPASHTEATPQEAVTLTVVTPRNELDIVADILYTSSDLPLAALQRIAANTPYQRKVDVLTAYLDDTPADHHVSDSVLETIRYDFDIVSTYGMLNELQKHPPFKHAIWQTLSPRLGYNTPPAIEDAALSEAFQHSFDRSLELYSVLQAAGFIQEAPYATLLGHKLRWSVNLTAGDIFRLTNLLTEPQTSPAVQELLQECVAKATEAHPILTSALHTNGTEAKPIS